MVNEAGSKKISNALWSQNGSFIAIIIEGGEIIMGSVDGDRLWNIDLKQDIQFVSFLENDANLVATTNIGQIFAIDCNSGEAFAEFEFSEVSDNKISFTFLEPIGYNYNKITIGMIDGSIAVLSNLQALKI